MKKIDAHSHIGVFGGWAGVSIDTEELIKQMDEYEIEKTILCSSNATNNDTISEAFKKYPDRFLPIVFANPCEKNAVESINYYIKEQGFLGIKLHPLMHSYVADSKMLDPVMETAEDLNIPVFIHCGHPPFSLPWSIGLLAERFPNVKVIMIHMGHGHGVYIDASLKMAKRYPNLYLEMSGMPMNSKIKQAYDEVGKDRIMFGIDTPFHHPTIEIQKVLTSGLDEQGLEDVFYNNAAKLMNLK
ncbi:putative amidohydrolase 2 [Gottschalkia acidurici 9a]|uniref:Amidohydrolase 2 n=1 Tax=Gottschalkia acidurici (strain ATCC 7906 / DSM 604 / BCRC 14475 / CIP 104303 / KCTC 5404 / NCIMB 10678 / 9a) TaxID=1128398 RepID=K0B149_GOTA9|nr:amidohydrolase family protein [Gottschalkia acidurici]AFS79743.1 putative amidohydrolase 2 [Gottschalkia acidurici 9a]